MPVSATRMAAISNPTANRRRRNNNARAKRAAQALSSLDLAESALDASSPQALIGTLLASRMNPKLRRALTAYMIGQVAYVQGKKWWNAREKKGKFYVSVGGTDNIFMDVQDWLLDLIPDEKRYSLGIKTLRHTGGYNAQLSNDWDYEDKPKSKDEKDYRMWLIYDGSIDQTIEIDGHKVRVSVSSPDNPPKNQEEMFTMWIEREKKITFSCDSIAARNAVISFLDRITDSVWGEKKVPNFYINSYGTDWYRRQDLPLRSPDTVILPEGQMERIIGDLKEFLDSEHRYNRLGVPYHRGYLFYGPPGTGKTSVARAIATHFNLDVYYLALPDITEDNKLMGLVSNVQPGSILLIEDIDVVQSTHNRDHEGPEVLRDARRSVSLSGLLNALDGIGTPHGLITMMTTNHIENLDPALIREGRVDLQELIGPLTNYQIEGLWQMTYNKVPGKLPTITDESELTTSQIVGILKKHLENPDTAYEEVRELLQSAVK